MRFVPARRGPERGTETRQYDLLGPNMGQKEPPAKSWPETATGSTICYGQNRDRKSHRDSAGPEKATETREYDLLRRNVGQKELPILGRTICYSQTCARKSHRDSAILFVEAKCGPEKATEARHYDLLRSNMGQKEPPRLGSTICYGQTWARNSHQNSAVRFVTAKREPERAAETRQYDLFRPNVGQKEPPRLCSTICYGKSWPERGTEIRQYDLLRPYVGQKETPTKTRQHDLLRPRVDRKSHQDSAVRFVTKCGPERATETRQWPNGGPEGATETRQYDLFRPRVGQKSQ